MEFIEKYVGIIEKTENANEYIIENYIPEIKLTESQEDTSYLFIEDNNKLHVRLGYKPKEKFEDNDVVTFDLLYENKSFPFKDCKIENLTKSSLVRGKDLIPKPYNRNKIYLKMIEKDIYFKSKFNGSLIGSRYEYILFDNSQMFADVYNACSEISKEKETFPLRNILSKIPYAYEEIKNIIKSLIMLGYLEFSETLNRVIVRDRLYKFNKSVLNNQVIIYQGEEVHTTDELCESRTPIQYILSERFIIENFAKYAKPFSEINNEYRTYLIETSPKCDPREVTDGN